MPESEHVVRRATAVVIMLFNVAHLMYVPELLGGGLSEMGYATLAQILIACGAAAVLWCKDWTAAWGAAFCVGTVSTIGILVSRTAGLPLMPDFVGRWNPLDLADLLGAICLAVLAGRTMVRRCGGVPVAASVACVIVAVTHQALLPLALEHGPFFAAAHAFLGTLGLVFAGVVLAGGVPVWVITFLVGLLNTGFFLVTAAVGVLPASMAPNPWWQPVLLTDGLAGAFLTWSAASMLIACRPWERFMSQDEPADAEPGHILSSGSVIAAAKQNPAGVTSTSA